MQEDTWEFELIINNLNRWRGEKWSGFPRFSESTFRALLDLMMISDPWPLKEKEQQDIERFLDKVSVFLGYKNWIVAYHEFDKGAKPKGASLEELKRMEFARPKGA